MKSKILYLSLGAVIGVLLGVISYERFVPVSIKSALGNAESSYQLAISTYEMKDDEEAAIELAIKSMQQRNSMEEALDSFVLLTDLFRLQLQDGNSDEETLRLLKLYGQFAAEAGEPSGYLDWAAATVALDPNKEAEAYGILKQGMQNTSRMLEVTFLAAYLSHWEHDDMKSIQAKKVLEFYSDVLEISEAAQAIEMYHNK